MSLSFQTGGSREDAENSQLKNNCFGCRGFYSLWILEIVNAFVGVYYNFQII